MVDKELSLPLAYPAFWGLSLGVVLMVGLLAGSYPSFYLSSFRPVQILKGTIIAGRNATLPRKLLVTGQFTASIVLISAAVIVYMQLSHVRSRDLGYNPNNLVLVESSAEVNRNIDAIRQELLQSGQVASVLRTTAPVTEIRNYTAGLEWAGMAPGQQLIIAAMGAEPGFSQTLGIRMVEGRDFRTGGADSSAMVLNEAAVRKMGLKDPVGREVRYNDRSYTIVGVSADVVMASPYQPVEPMMILPVRNYAGAVHIRLKDGVEVQAALSSIGNVFRRFNPEVPFEYRFADQEFSRKFLTEELIGKLANLFTGLSIFISCLGLFGLVAFSVEKRRREIGIRKVLGAPVAHILLLVSREFLYLIGLAFVLAVPVAWWIMHQWLENFAYRTTVHPLLFAAVGVVMLLITLVTISLNAFRSAVSSPVRNLRSE
jgi:ABC-type antimicrobial peptide transport system permease subunit